MALPYKLLKTITIDGETMGVDTTVGTSSSNAKTVTVPASLTSWTDGASLDLEANTLYLIQTGTFFGAASTTGATWFNLRVTFGTSSSTLYRELSPTNESNYKTVSFGLKTGASPVTLKTQLQSNRILTNSTSELYAYKLLSYVGG